MKDELLEISSLMPDQEMQSHERADIKLNKTQQISTTNFSSNLNVNKLTQAERDAHAEYQAQSNSSTLTGIAAKTLHEILTQQKKKFMGQQALDNKIETSPVPVKTEKYLTYE